MVRIARVRNPHVEALVWRMVLVAGLALPALLYWRLAPSFATSLELPVIAAEGAGGTLPQAAPSSWLPRLPAAIYLRIVYATARSPSRARRHVACQPGGATDGDS